MGRPHLTFTARTGRYLIRESGSDEAIAVTAAGEQWSVISHAREGLRVRDPRGYLSLAHARPLRVEPVAGGAGLDVEEQLYPGAIEVRQDETGVTVVNELPLEEYLRGVLARELPGRGHAPEALKAQAVAARTYALKRMGSRAALGFDLFADTQDQVYAGVGDASPAADRALADTRGRALLAGGNLIDAYYHSTCGGSTASVEEAFPQPPVPYLVSVSDADGRRGFHCSSSRYFRWQAAYERDALETIVTRNLGRFVTLPSGGPGDLRDLEVSETSSTGRVTALRVETTAGNFQVARNDVRWLFADGGSPGLRSTLFLLRGERQRGEIRRVTLVGGGWGHGVGMCQVGAVGRATAGAACEQILRHYYRGTHLERLYG